MLWCLRDDSGVKLHVSFLFFLTKPILEISATMLAVMRNYTGQSLFAFGFLVTAQLFVSVSEIIINELFVSKLPNLKLGNLQVLKLLQPADLVPYIVMVFVVVATLAYTWFKKSGFQLETEDTVSLLILFFQIHSSQNFFLCQVEPAGQLKETRKVFRS